MVSLIRSPQRGGSNRTSRLLRVNNEAVTIFGESAGALMQRLQTCVQLAPPLVKVRLNAGRTASPPSGGSLPSGGIAIAVLDRGHGVTPPSTMGTPTIESGGQSLRILPKVPSAGKRVSLRVPPAARVHLAEGGAR